MYIKSSLKCKIIDELIYMKPHIESIFVENKNIIMGNIYRPPNSNLELFINDLTSILGILATKPDNVNVIIGGDFNIDLLKLNSNSKYLEYFLLMQSYGLDIVITRPTRVTYSSATIIDHIWSNKLQNITKCGIILSSITDHFPICITTKYYQANNSVDHAYKKYSIRLRNELSDGIFRNILSRADWNDLLTKNNVADIFSSFNDIVVKAYDAAFPVVERRRKIKDLEKPYIDHEIKQLIRDKHKLQKKYYRYPITYNNEYKTIKNKLSKLINNAKCKYYQNKLLTNKNDPKKSWKIINETMGHTNKKLPLKAHV